MVLPSAVRHVSRPVICGETVSMGIRTSLILALVCFISLACSDSERSIAQTMAATASTTPATASSPASTVDTDALMGEVREELVQLVMQRDGLDRAAAEQRADDLLAQGADQGTVGQQMTLYSNWMSNYPLHPVLGRHWTEEQAECVIVTMMQVEGIARTAALVSVSQTGGMEVSDALALVQPVGFCADMLAMMRADMTALGVPQDLDCLLAGLVEEDVASWFVALFTHGREGFNVAMAEDLDLSCPADS